MNQTNRKQIFVSSVIWVINKKSVQEVREKDEAAAKKADEKDKEL
jgi:hypothetical protein